MRAWKLVHLYTTMERSRSERAACNTWAMFSNSVWPVCLSSTHLCHIPMVMSVVIECEQQLMPPPFCQYPPLICIDQIAGYEILEHDLRRLVGRAVRVQGFPVWAWRSLAR